VGQKVTAKDRLKRSYCCPTAANALSSVLEILLFGGFAGKKESRRADSNRLPLLQLRVIIQKLQGLAHPCNFRISKRLYRLRFAGCCTVLRLRWYQSGINIIRIFA
jgi:hypothetical protein